MNYLKAQTLSSKIISKTKEMDPRDKPWEKDMVGWNKHISELLFLNDMMDKSIGTKSTMDRLVEEGKLESNPFDGYNCFEDYWKENKEEINRRIK